MIRAATLAALACGVAVAASAQDPAVDYMLQCRGCHLADGSGAPGAVPDLRGSLAIPRWPAGPVSVRVQVGAYPLSEPAGGVLDGCSRVRPRAAATSSLRAEESPAARGILRRVDVRRELLRRSKHRGP